MLRCLLKSAGWPSDCRYLNLFLKYSKVKYEQLADVTAYLQQGHFFVLTDAKSGYHHVFMHESTWPYLAIKFEGQISVFTVLPFGMAEACGVYTTVMGEVYRPLRQVHQSLSFLIDDALFAAQSKLHACFLARTLAMLLTALGFFLSWEKCQLVPTQCGKFLGLLVDSQSCQLIVPADKVIYIKELIQQALDAPSVSRRQLASISSCPLHQQSTWHLCTPGAYFKQCPATPTGMPHWKICLLLCLTYSIGWKTLTYAMAKLG